MDGMIRSSGVGIPSFRDMINDLPPLDDVRSRFMDGVGPQADWSIIWKLLDTCTAKWHVQFRSNRCYLDLMDKLNAVFTRYKYNIGISTPSMHDMFPTKYTSVKKGCLRLSQAGHVSNEVYKHQEGISKPLGSPTVLAASPCRSLCPSISFCYSFFLVCIAGEVWVVALGSTSVYGPVFFMHSTFTVQRAGRCACTELVQSSFIAFRHHLIARVWIFKGLHLALWRNVSYRSICISYTVTWCSTTMQPSWQYT